MDEAIKLGVELARLAVDLFDGRETEAGARRRVRDILPDKSHSEQAAEDIIAARRLAAIADMDEPGDES